MKIPANINELMEMVNPQLKSDVDRVTKQIKVAKNIGITFVAIKEQNRPQIEKALKAETKIKSTYIFTDEETNTALLQLELRVDQ